MNSRLPFLRLVAAALILQLPVVASAQAHERGAAESSPWVALARGRVEPPGGIVQVAANRDGFVKNIFGREGDEVTKGTVLATMDDKSARLHLALAQRELAQTHASLVPLQLRKSTAEREARRLDQLVAQELANAQDVDRARDRVAEVEAEISQVAVAEDAMRARVDLAQYEVDACAIRAPIDGQILRRLASPGEGTSAGNVTPLFWLAPSGPRVVRAQLDEDSVHLVAAGQRAEVVIESTPNAVIKARVQKMGLFFGSRRLPTDDPAEREDVRVVDCVLVLEDAPPSLLLGQRVLVRFLRGGQAAR